jgi:hypothetical protein
MPNETVVLWIAGGLFTFITMLVGVVWKLLRDESKGHAEAIKDKADTDRMNDMERRLQFEIAEAKADTEKLVNKLEAKHDKEIEQLSARLTDQIRSTETNILAQLKLMIEMVRKQETR